MKAFSIVIPIYNEDKYIKGLLESIFQIKYPPDSFEVIVVNDASTDHTKEIVKRFSEVHLIDLKENVGRFAARKIGAETAEHPHILFVDSRAVVDWNILSVLNQSSEKIIIGTVLSVENPGLFDTFYRAIRRVVFRKYYAMATQPIVLTKDNFDSLPKGTTVLYVQKELLFDAYKKLSGIEIGKNSSDDIRLINMIVQSTNAVIHPDVKIVGMSRSSFRASVLHLIWRGSTFVDYYLNPSKRNFWLVIVLPLFMFLGILTALIFAPISGAIKITALFVLDLTITLFLSKTLREFAIILFMLPLCATVFYTGIIRGIYLKFKQTFKIK